MKILIMLSLNNYNASVVGDFKIFYDSDIPLYLFYQRCKKEYDKPNNYEKIIQLNYIIVLL